MASELMHRLLFYPKNFFLAKIQAIKIPGININRVDARPILILNSNAFNSKSVNNFPLNELTQNHSF